MFWTLSRGRHADAARAKTSAHTTPAPTDAATAARTPTTQRRREQKQITTPTGHGCDKTKYDRHHNQTKVNKARRIIRLDILK